MNEVEKITELDALSNYLSILKVKGYTMTKEQAEREIQAIEAHLKRLKEPVANDVTITSHFFHNPEKGKYEIPTPQKIRTYQR